MHLRFSDGSLSNAFTELYPEKRSQPTITEILNATTGDRIYLDPVTRSSITLEESVTEVRRTISETDTEGCPAGVDLAKLPQLSRLLGMRTVYYANRDAFGDMVETWMAPDLNCLPPEGDPYIAEPWRGA